MTPQLSAALAVIKSDDHYAVARARALITVYDEVWGEKWAGEYEVLSVETEFAFPLLNPDTEAPSKSFDEGGKMDVRVRHKPTNRNRIVEHKTTSDSVEPDSDYWDRLRMDTQISKYWLAEATSGGDIDAVIYDAVGKPAHRPCQIPTLDEHNLKIVLDQNGNRVMTKDGKKPRETADNEKGWVLLTLPESPEQFETRLTNTLREDKSKYFAQREVPRLSSDLLEYMEDAWATTQELLYRRKTNCWPRNPDACKALGTCEYFDLCTGRAAVDGIRYRVTRNAHPELKRQEGESGRQLLTTSRTKCLKQCARKHLLRYEQRIERVGIDSDALAFGTLMHTAWEQYFLTLKTTKTP